MKHFGDITKLNGAELPVVDCITGGSPCQDLSIAGGRAGLDGERSGLFIEQIRIVKEMREHDRASGRADEFVRPRYMVWENVPGAFSSNEGRDFQTVLTEIVRSAEPDSPEVPMPEKNRWEYSGCLYDEMGGWSIAWRLHDAQFWGVPQRRKRIALVADFGGMSAPEVLFERKGLLRHSETSRETGEGIAAAVKGCADEASDRSNNDIKADANTPVMSSYGFYPQQKAEGIAFKEEVSGSLVIGTNPGYQNGVLTYAMQRSDEFKGSEVASTLRQRDYKDFTDLILSKQNDGHEAKCIGNGQTNQISMKETANPLDTMHDHQAIIDMETDGKGDTVASRVRRLTPLECERLQGFPDGWTDIGEWVDSNGKTRQPSDGPRYKALGNSIAIPFWSYLLRRISAQYERPATLGSLFDGIGGFPYCWEMCNGRGTALWASEIEEFPIAVTKKRFPEEE